VDIYLTSMQIAALSIAGMCHALLGSIKVPLARQLEIDEARVGGLVSVFGFTLIPMAFAAGIFADSFGRDTVLVAGFVLLILSVLVLAHLKSYRMAVLSVLLLGTGWSALVNVLNATQGPSFLPLDEIADRLSYAMNLGDFVFGMGAFLMPIVVGYSLRRMGLRSTFMVFASLIMIPLVLSFAVDWQRIAPEEATRLFTFSDLLHDKIVWICCIAFLFHVPVEACVATWATTLMIERGVEEKNSNLLLSAFWLTFTVSRLIAAISMPFLALLIKERAMDVETDHLVVVALAVIMLVVVLGLVTSRGKFQTSTLLIFAGLILGPIFPILIAQLVGHVSAELPTMEGRAIGLFFCIGGIGWAVIPFMVGRMADRVGLQKSFLVVACCSAGLVVMCTVLYLFG
jgi:fucose permease